MPGKPIHPESIRLCGVRQNNLKNFDLELPIGKLIVITGPSGSGKSSLAFETLFAEGQRRYIETFSPYARQFFDRMDKPAVDRIENIPPSIAIEQRNSVKTTRSTVSTMTEIADYMKHLWPHVAELHCRSCGKPVIRDHPAQIWDRTRQTVRSTDGAADVLICFDLQLSPKMTLAEELELLVKQGYQRLIIDLTPLRIDELAERFQTSPPTHLTVLQDRVAVAESQRARFIEACEQAFHFGKGRLTLLGAARKGAPPQSAATVIGRYSRQLHCAGCDIEYREPSPGLFHFNHPSGACPSCKGFGRVITIDYRLAVPDTSKTLAEGVVRPWLTGHGLESQEDLLKFCKKRKVPTNIPFRDLPSATQRWVLDGDPDYGKDADHQWPAAWYGVKGYFKWLESKSYKMHVRVMLSRYRSYVVCQSCGGARFQPEALLYKALKADGGELSLADFYQLPVSDALVWLDHALSSGGKANPLDPAFRMALSEVARRLRYLEQVGLGYLTLDRPTRTLSGGETERVSLTTCLGASLVNTLFVLDEPSVGLHHRDTRRLVRILEQLRDAGNTVVVVEHDPEIIRAADFVVDIGPASGEHGGRCVFAGPREHLAAARDVSATARFLESTRQGSANSHQRRPRPTSPEVLQVRQASLHNLRGLDVSIPLGRLVCITGVSGSGKTTLVRELLHPALKEKIASRPASTDSKEGEEAAQTEAAEATEAGVDASLRGSGRIEIEGWESLRHTLLVDQSSLGKTPRSNPALYIGAFSFIREVFAASEESKRQGLKESSFSFNSQEGQCQRCRGAGFEQIEMQFLSDVYIRCPDCNGRRYRPHILDVCIQPPRVPGKAWPQIGSPDRGASIADLLEATVDDAVLWLDAMRNGKKRCPATSAIASLRLLSEVGLGYLRLGQAINTLSGGECQRLKLVSHMAEFALQADPQPTLFIFDEPTTGLHLQDVERLLQTFQKLVDLGHSLLVIEHNLEVMRAADWIIDIGPEGGSGGGKLVATGTPEDVARNRNSHTGRSLRGELADDGEGLGKRESFGVLHEAIAPFGAPANAICLRGAREHNLRNLSLDIPRNQFVVLTGVSGSGKSTLAFDLIFAEGQRRFLDSMSAYARQFVDQLVRPEVDQITGIPPTVSIEQRLSRGGGKSTVATVTEVHQFLRLLYARLGTQYCPDCLEPVTAQTRDSLLRLLLEEGSKRGDLLLLAPVVRGRKGFHTDVGLWAQKHGYKEVRADGKLYPTDQPLRLDRFKEHNVEVVIGVLDRPAKRAASLAAEARELVETALKVGQGVVMTLDNHGKTSLHSTLKACASCGKSFGELEPKSFSYNSPVGWCPKCRGFGELFYLPDVERGARADAIEESWFEWQEGKREPCPECEGARLNPLVRNVRLDIAATTGQGGRGSRVSAPGKAIHEIGAFSVSEAMEFFKSLTLDGSAALIARDILPEIRERLRFLAEVGLGYLHLDRAVPTLSGGESQRIRLAAQLGSNLSGVLYVLDEPTIGLHPRDNDQLLDTLQRLQSRGNSLIVVEHDDQTMKRADHIIDLGPGAGVHGGQVVARGTLEDLRNNPASVTGRCLREPVLDAACLRNRPVDLPAATAPITAKTKKAAKEPTTTTPKHLTLSGAAQNNLKNLDVRIPLGRFVAVTGVSGSGKSTLIRHCLIPALQAALKGEKPAKDGPRIEGWEGIQALHEVDQSPIGRTPRSTPATYVGFFDIIRELFAQTPEARLRGYGGGRFSFNSAQGRCPVCDGAGNTKLEMNFLPPAFVKCDACNGLRFNRETLDITYGGKTIAEVLDLSVEEACIFFAAIPRLKRALEALQETGLGYVRLGQTSPTLSGGEAQRIKLVSHLLSGWGERTGLRSPSKRDFFVLEEPTIGLHMADVRRLVGVIQKLVDVGHTVVVIEHNMELISAADWVIDLGPEAGEGGGRLVVEGSPVEVARHPASHTGRYLRESGVLPSPITGAAK